MAPSRRPQQSKPSVQAAIASPTDAELQRQAAELASFRRMLIASEGTFSLSFAVCTNRTLRNALIDQLRGEFSGIELVELPSDSVSIHDTVKQRIVGQHPAAIFINDLEHFLPFGSKHQPMLADLNLSRENWEDFHCPVVFWLSEYAAVLVATKAADLWRYRSHHFEFVSAAATPEAGLRETFAGYDMLAGLPYDQKRFRMAELEQRIEHVGPEPSPELRPHLVTWSYELAELCKIFGKYSRSEELLRRILASEEKAHGPDSPQVATALNNLGWLLKETNRLAEAEPLMRRALAIDEQFYGAKHPNVACELNNLAVLLQHTNRLAEAEPLIRRALAIVEQSMGPEHPYVANCLNNLAQLLKATNRLAEAEPLMRRVLAIWEQCYGTEHPNAASALNNLAQLLQDTNRLAEAEPLMRRALEICEASLGPVHPKTQTAAKNLKTLLAEKAKRE